MRTSTALPALVLAVGATLAAGPAHAAPGPACGDTLTRDTVLTRNLTCPSGDGLWLAPGVTLDLGGKVLAGHDGGNGVVAPPSGDVTVTNGVIAGWRTGLTADDPGYDPETGEWVELGGTVHVDRVVLRDNGTGIDGTGRLYGQKKLFTVDRSTLRGNVTGFATTGGYGSFHRTTLRDNGVALYANTGGVAVSRSVLRDNDYAFSGGGESGITVTSTAVLDNRIGFQAWFMDSVEITRSEVRGHDVALDIAGDAGYTKVHDTTLTGNDVAVDVQGSPFEVRRSTFRKNGVAVRSAENSWPDAPFDRTAEVTGSTFADGGDGLVSQFAGMKVGGNTATGNTGRGIHAPGAQDLGGNTARGNGTEPQCVGVVCAPAG
ncbi:hypothetical protein [Cellulomonas sp. SLBN-39]|uniref:hypothetical protein n=1 Tax=Cellulomonas sp. SLBN-39 TaxID=2768446 RepID=UPI00114DC3C4|nr:hypothetical protein [Cellulomonas sp. SLBN-39]TQL01901.1 hypothetical protein FBY24_0964 [Cellulomonas sp. SLBN-39]